MQGYIIKVSKARDEDVIVTILAQNNLYTLYRFYGARHSQINLGFKIDFEVESSAKVSMSRLRKVMHLSMPCLLDRSRLFVWQQFTGLFYKHLQDTEELDSFYFQLLEDASNIWKTQSPKRIAIEAYVKLLKFEGRLHTSMNCFFCEEDIHQDLTLIRAFLPAHAQCIFAIPLNIDAVKELFDTGSSLFLEDKEIERIWHILLEGF
ncbi:recombination protein RecO [Sulfurimonas sp. MAG313]|nr:recombination protein RecO [Sulfurimonas sp. MAG313]MDF1882045.1 recombination protein RecO [Sulfurimonas sp. MAG313]